MSEHWTEKLIDAHLEAPNTAEPSLGFESRLLIQVAEHRAARRPISWMIWASAAVAAAILLFFARRQQVKQECGDAGFLQHTRHVLIARTSPAAAASVRKEHEPACILGRGKIAVEIRSLHWNPDCLWLLHSCS